MLKKLLIFLLLVAAAAWFYISKQPDEFYVSRSIIIQSTPTQIFPHVNDLRKWNEWSPWAKKDPHMDISFDGPDQGVGSSMSWVGNSKVGEGKITIERSQPYEIIALKLNFYDPIESTSDAQFNFTQKNGATEVTWQMSGKNTMVGKAAALIFNMDTMIGEQFEEGLASLKSLVE